jgi:hypothetical protein
MYSDVNYNRGVIQMKYMVSGPFVPVEYNTGWGLGPKLFLVGLCVLFYFVVTVLVVAQ